MDESPETIMTLDEVVAYLRLPKSTVYRLVQSGKIPGQKAGRQWRFHRDAIDAWLSAGPAKKPKVVRGKHR
ncbi:MAG TPA: helix-turn-helix domain-containing protein [Candidatus Hydrogenedentes bacterium]|nr:helix-turn-helix domain-containing protein [Candidatus Hydrogenedentota bacterium]HQK75795.1 helix-turn-helix domain-containing protein [Candidatus Hydrogenedentota bacterium]HRT20501.1 helix-turn-helix domain-containing protein [Candidatus Hydrogenedentota bacterium]HRT65164.1 helix-turn-helix domain-containing protein [Candidatus Hydrogenedentota bacterium]